MDKLNRNERIAGLMHILTSKPNFIFTYSYFCSIFNVKKPSISGDITIMKELVEKLDIGTIETISGANGGVRFMPKVREEDTKKLLRDLCLKLSTPDRVIPGGFIYMMDVLYSPNIVRNLGKIFSNKFIDKKIDCVVTIETKGIPIGLMTAENLNVPLVIIRKNSKVTEGPTVNINYISGSTKKIQTMSLSKRAIKQGSRILVIDDFMRAGGTIKGIYEMMMEFGAEVVGTGIFISTIEPEKKLIKDYTSLILMEKIDEENKKIFLRSNYEKLK